MRKLASGSPPIRLARVASFICTTKAPSCRSFCSRILTFGCGDVGRGCAESLRGQGAGAIVTEIDATCALQAAMVGYQVDDMDVVIFTMDIFVAATGCFNVPTADQGDRVGLTD